MKFGLIDLMMALALFVLGSLCALMESKNEHNGLGVNPSGAYAAAAVCNHCIQKNFVFFQFFFILKGFMFLSAVLFLFSGLAHLSKPRAPKRNNTLDEGYYVENFFNNLRI